MKHLLIIAITYLCFTSNAPTIEKELAKTNNQSLNDNNIQLTQASDNRQSIIFTGISPCNEIVIKPLSSNKLQISIVEPEIKNIIVKKDNSNKVTEIENCQQQFDDLLASHSIQFQTAQLSYSSLKLISELSDVTKRCTKYTIVI